MFFYSQFTYKFFPNTHALTTWPFLKIRKGICERFPYHIHSIACSGVWNITIPNLHVASATKLMPTHSCHLCCCVFKPIPCSIKTLSISRIISCSLPHFPKWPHVYVAKSYVFNAWNKKHPKCLPIFDLRVISAVSSY